MISLPAPWPVGLFVTRGGGPVYRTLSTSATSDSRWNHIRSLICLASSCWTKSRVSSRLLSRSGEALVDAPASVPWATPNQGSKTRKKQAEPVLKSADIRFDSIGCPLLGILDGVFRHEKIINSPGIESHLGLDLSRVVKYQADASSHGTRSAVCKPELRSIRMKANSIRTGAALLLWLCLGLSVLPAQESQPVTSVIFKQGQVWI